VDRGDDRLSQPPHMRPQRDALGVGALPELDEIGERLALGINVPWGGFVALALVVAGAESAAGAGEDDDADGAVGVRPVEGAMQLGFKLVRERIHSLGAIERDGRDALLDAVDDLLAHPSSFPLASAHGLESARTIR